jgi:regulator of RNase E activity RraA
LGLGSARAARPIRSACLTSTGVIPMFRPFLALLGALFLACSPAAAETLNATPATAEAVLKAAKPGDVVVLAAGDYARTGLRDRMFAPRLTIQAKGATLNGWGFSKGII